MINSKIPLVNIDIPKVPEFSIVSPMISASNASIITSGLYVMLNKPTYGTILDSIFTYDATIDKFKAKYGYGFCNIEMLYTNKTSFPSFSNVDVNTMLTNTIDLPFIFPMLLNDLTTLGINMSANQDGAAKDDINFYRKEYHNTPLLFKELNVDAYNVFYNTSTNDVNKSSVDLINYNMQYCIVTTEILDDYLKSQSNWINYSNLKSLPTITWQIPKYFDVKGKNPNYKGARYSSSVLSPIALDYRFLLSKTATVFSPIPNIINPNLFLFRKAVNTATKGLNLEFSTKSIIMTSQNIGLSNYNDGFNDYIYISYVAKMNFAKFTNGVIVNDFGTYPMLSGNIINYVTQSITKSQSSTVNGVYNDINNGIETVQMDYSVPMIAKYKIEYTDSTKILTKLTLVDAAALNQLTINNGTSNGTMPGFGNLRDKQFVRAPFIVNNTIYNWGSTNKVNGISLIPQNHILDSVVDAVTNKVLCVYFSTSIAQNIPSDVQYDSPYKNNIVGGNLMLNVYNTNTTLSKIAPETHTLISNISRVAALRIIKHNDDYYIAVAYNTVSGGQYTSYVYKLVYSAGVIASFTKQMQFDNCTKISIQGVKNGDME